MIQIAYLRRKCIGCNACVENAPRYWVMSQKDGKSYLRKSTKKGDYYILHAPDMDYDENLRAAEHCPVNIIYLKLL
ncbi:MAG: ferredoxin [Bacteroidetes bacterium]|nr:ferredoxin [Bacteroidota bacterium]